MTKRYSVILTEEERIEPLFIIKKDEPPVSRIKHAHILLNADKNGPNITDREKADFIKSHPQAVFNIRKRFTEMVFDPAIYRKHREKSPIQPIVDGKKEAQLIAIACSKPPEGCSRWTFKLLSERMVELEIVDSISPKTVERV